MPSSSNKNKLGLPVFPPPQGQVCIPVTVPDDPQWIGLLLGAIYRLGQQVWYDRDEAHTAKLVAAVWQDIYLETVKATWDCEGGAGMFDLRVSPTDDCLIEKTLDGVVWQEAFRLDTDCALTRIIRNPDTGAYGWEVEDVGFYRFPDGPWGQSVVNPIAPPPTHSAASDPVCLAAANAAAVYAELYKRVAAELLDQVATDFELAANLGTAISGFLMLIGAAATQPYVAISSILGLIGVRQQYIDNPLTAGDIEDLKCYFYLNGIENTDGSVNFNFQGVWDAIALDSPKNTLVRLLLTLLGPDALSFAGSVDYVTSADCYCSPFEEQDYEPVALYGNTITSLGNNWYRIRSAHYTGNQKMGWVYRTKSTQTLKHVGRIYEARLVGPYTSWSQFTQSNFNCRGASCGGYPTCGSLPINLNTMPTLTHTGCDRLGDMGSQFTIEIMIGPCVLP